MNFRVKNSDENGTTVQTDSGHEFRLAPKAVPSNDETDFRLGDLQADLIEETERPQLAHAILNEIIGAPAPQPATANATKTD